MSIEKFSVPSLEAPAIKEAPDGDLDWHALEGKNFTATIKNLPSNSVGNELKLTWKGTTSDGEELPPRNKTHTIEWSDIFGDLELELDNDFAKSVVGGTAVIAYIIGTDLESHPLTIKVIDVTPAPELNAPEVIEAIDSVLSPDWVGNDGATVLVKTVAPIVKDDQIFFKIIAINSDEETIELKPKTVAGPVQTVLRIPKDLIEAITGGSLAIDYTVVEKTSPTLKLFVGYGIVPPTLEVNPHPQPGATSKVIVPKYTGMKGDKIAVSIEMSRLSYRSSQEELSELKDKIFEIPSGIFISALSTSATVQYHVSSQDAESKKTWSSLPLNVDIIGQGTIMAPPIYLSFADTAPRYNLSYRGIVAGSQVTVYWHAEGKEPRQAELTIKYDGDFHYVPICLDWLTEDKNRTVCGNYSILQNDGAVRKFSPGMLFKA